MKKLTLIILAIGLLFSFTQCTDTKEEDSRTLITKKIQYDVPIVNMDPTYDWWIKNIEGSDREALLDNIFDKALSGELQAYDYFMEPLSKKGVQRMLVDTLVQTLMRSTEPYEEYDTMIINKIEPGHVSMIRFLEEWKYDEKTLKIDKKIYAISPVLEVNINGEKVTRPLFWIYTDDSILKGK